MVAGTVSARNGVIYNIKRLKHFQTITTSTTPGPHQQEGIHVGSSCKLLFMARSSLHGQDMLA
jgi:hypothetical protein